MVQIAVLKKSGEDGELDIVSGKELKPGPDEVVIKNTAIGLSKLDVATRAQLAAGYFPSGEVTLGYEGAGVVVEAGSNVHVFKPGSRVAYFIPTAGACATHCKVSVQYVVSLPKDIPEKVAAALILKGMLAHTLTARAYSIIKSSIVLVHEADIPTGKVIGQFAKYKGAKMIIGAVASQENIQRVELEGIYTHVFNYNDANFVNKVMSVTNKKGVNAVYDGVGSEYITQKSLEVLSMFGFLALYNSSVFEISSIPILSLAKKSLFLTAFTVFQYKSLRQEIVLTAEEIFDMVYKGALKISYVEYNASKLQNALDSIKYSNAQDSIIITF